MEVRLKRCVAFVLILLDIFFAVAGSMLTTHRQVAGDIGRATVKLMYEFETIDDLPSNYATLYQFVEEEDWIRLNIDNDLRVVNTYYKFNTLRSDVSVLGSDRGCVAYRLINGNIPAQTIWLFNYETAQGKIRNIREYSLTNVKYGGEGVW